MVSSLRGGSRDQGTRSVPYNPHGFVIITTDHNHLTGAILALAGLTHYPVYLDVLKNPEVLEKLD